MRQFKTEFYGKFGEGKNVFVMNTYVASQKRYDTMDNEDVEHGIETINRYIASLQGFKEDLLEKLLVKTP